MADMCDTCGDGVVELLRKILEQERDTFVRLGQLTASGGVSENVNISAIGGVATSVNCGTADAGTLRVAQATDCVVPVEGSVLVTNGAGAAAVNIQDGGNTITVDGTVTTTPSGVQAVEGNVAHDAIDSGNPVKTGAVAIAHGTNPTAVAAADRTNLYANRAGVPFVIGGHPNVQTLEARYTAAQTDTAIVTVAAGLKIVVTQIGALCDHANTVDVGLRVGFGAATTPTTSGVVLTHGGIAPGSGYSRGDGSGILGVGADGEDLRITSEVPTTGDLRILVSFYTIES